MTGVFQSSVFQGGGVFQVETVVDSGGESGTGEVAASLGADVNHRFAAAPCHTQIVSIPVVTS
jgi:hypothetical protein